jgi:hypothetical protein
MRTFAERRVSAHDKAAGEKHERAKALVEELWRDRTGVVIRRKFTASA